MFEKFKTLLINELTKGTSAHSLALACAVGISIGIFPLMGTTTALCLLLGGMLKLNQPFLQIVHYMMTPFQVLLIPIFLWVGESILKAPHLSLDPRVVYDSFFQDKAVFFSKFGMAGVHAVFAWILIGPALGAVTYFISRAVIIRILTKMEDRRKANFP